MAFSSTVTSRENLGSVNMLYGTYTNGTADSGGTITTGFGVIVMFGTVPTGAVEETMPKYAVSAGVVTLVTNNGSAGNWFAVGK
jgi:hypothetical protein